MFYAGVTASKRGGAVPLSLPVELPRFRRDL